MAGGEVVEEADAGGAGSGAGAVERQRQPHVGLGGLALDCGGAAHGLRFSRTRACIDSACTSKPSARAIGAPAAASFAAAAPMCTSDIVRRKCRGESVEAKRAAPLVGST